jgi:diacylglycerol kinase (ATP)
MTTDAPTSPSTSVGGGHVAVIANPASGSSGDDAELRAAFAAAGVAAEWMPTTPDDPGIGQAAEAVAANAGTVVACGGDGTVRAVLQSLAGTAVTLGVVPLGTGNLLAANLSIETGLKAVDVAVHGPTTIIDVGVVNDERFAVMAGVGFDALMIRDANAGLKRRIGSAAYVLSAARNLRSRVFRAVVTADGSEAFRGRTAMVLVGNCGAVTGGLEVFPDARHDDGLLDVAVLSARGLRQWSSVGWRLMRGRPQRSDLVHRCQGREVTVALSRPIAYELDGEVRDPTGDLRFTVEPQALTVRVPHTTS